MKGHVSDTNLPRYRKLRAIAKAYTDLGNLIGARDTLESSRCWAKAGVHNNEAMKLREDFTQPAKTDDYGVEWREVIGFTDYETNSLGDVRLKLTLSTMKTSKNTHEFYRLRRFGVTHSKGKNRIVKEAFPELTKKDIP